MYPSRTIRRQALVALKLMKMHRGLEEIYVLASEMRCSFGAMRLGACHPIRGIIELAD